jgi:hypothetical protein
MGFKTNNQLLAVQIPLSRATGSSGFNRIGVSFGSSAD